MKWTKLPDDCWKLEYGLYVAVIEMVDRLDPEPYAVWVHNKTQVGKPVAYTEVKTLKQRNLFWKK
jgi:hypothetical protein